MKRKPSGYWSIDRLKTDLKEVISEYYDQTGIIPLLSTVNNELISGITDVIYRLVGTNRNQFYLDFLKENGFPEPDGGLFKDGVLFRGHYEYVGYCFVKAWGINIIPIKKVGKYYSDGYFMDIDTYWEHWGGLNKNNAIKKKLYKKNKLKLFETYDGECIKHGKGYEYLYNTMRNFFINNGYDIPQYNKNELYKLLRKEVPTFENMLDWVVNTIRNEPSLQKELTTKRLSKFYYGQKIMSFFAKHFNGISNFKEYLNEEYNFNYKIERHVNKHYYLNEENLFRELTPIVKKYGRLPSKVELSAEGRRDIVMFITKHFGGFKDMRRNEIHIGKYFHIIDDMLDGKAPWDLKIDWDTDIDDTIRKIIQYWKDKDIELPYYFSDLRDNKKYGNIGGLLYNIIIHRTSNKLDIKNWTEFKRKFDNYNGPEIPEIPYKKTNIPIGTIIGNWTVLEELDLKHYNSIKNIRIRNFIAKCSCGIEKEITLPNMLRCGSHCGCKLRKPIDFIKKYGKLTILKEVETKPGKNRKVIVECECKTIRKLDYSFIKNGVITNCGCIKSMNKQKMDYRAGNI